MGEWLEEIFDRLLVGTPYPPQSLGLVVGNAVDLPYPLDGHLVAGLVVITPAGLAYLGSVQTGGAYVLELGNANPDTGVIVPWQQIAVDDDDAPGVFLSEILSTAPPRTYTPPVVADDAGTLTQVPADVLDAAGAFWRVGNRLFVRVVLRALDDLADPAGDWAVYLPRATRTAGAGIGSGVGHPVGRWCYVPPSGTARAGGDVVLADQVDDGGDLVATTVRLLYGGAGALAAASYVGVEVPEPWVTGAAVLLDFSIPDYSVDGVPPTPPDPFAPPWSHTFDAGPLGDPIYGDETGSGMPILVQGAGTFSDQHTGGAGYSMHCDAIVEPEGGLGYFQRDRQAQWAPPNDPFDYDDAVDPMWCGDWVEITFAFTISGFPDVDRILFFRFVPVASLWLSATSTRFLYKATGYIPGPGGLTYDPVGLAITPGTRYEVRLRFNRDAPGELWMSDGVTETTDALPAVDLGADDFPLMQFGPWGPETYGIAVNFPECWIDSLGLDWDTGA